MKKEDRDGDRGWVGGERNVTREKERNGDGDKDGKCVHTVTGTRRVHLVLQPDYPAAPPMAGDCHTCARVRVQMVLTSRPLPG